MAQKRDGGFDTDVREPKRYCELAAAKHQQEENLEGHSVVDETNDVEPTRHGHAARADGTEEEAICFGMIRIYGVVPEDEWKSKVEARASLPLKNARKVYMRASILLIGPRPASEQVARSLATCQLYLQDAPPGLTSYPYVNPQSLEIPQMPVMENVFSSLEPFSYIDYGIEIDPPLAGRTREADNLFADVADFFDEFTSHEFLPQAITDIRIKTPLLSHQSQGVDFIAGRERMNVSSEHPLWQSHALENGQVCYQHTITGAKSQSPEDSLGGILADDMGLGKTLTILAAIVGSLGAATDFASGSILATTSGVFELRARSSLVIVPSELLLNTWAAEIRKHFSDGILRFSLYHGSKRHNNEIALLDQDIVLTTYGTLMADFRRRNGIIFRACWYRLILDEAHSIRNYNNKQFQAVTQISAHIRWCLTGTPIQNSLDDLGALVKFLKLPVLDNPAIFRRYILKSSMRRRFVRNDLENLRKLLMAICLRRTKSLLKCFTYKEEQRRPDFTAEEHQQYKSLEAAVNGAIKVAISTRDYKGTHHRVMEALLRLRMFCNNGVAIQSMASEPDEVLSLLHQSGNAICGICCCEILMVNDSSNSGLAYLTPCNQILCVECMLQCAEESKLLIETSEWSCPLCHEKHRKQCSALGRDPNNPERGTLFRIGIPSKTKAVLEDIQTHHLEEKCIVFTFWKKTLDILATALDAADIKYCRLDGSLTTKRRNEVLTDFRVNAASKVLIMTFSTGAIGLNGLTVASRVHILEPQWNPAVESQAIGRVLRVDQDRQVTVIRYAMRKSIEDMIQSRQLHKLRLAGGGFALDDDNVIELIA